MKLAVLAMASIFLLVSFPEVADARCGRGYKKERTRIFHKAPKRRLLRGKVRKGRTCLKIVKPALRKKKRLFFIEKGRRTEISSGAIPRNANKKNYKWKTSTRKDEVVCPAGTRLQRTSIFHSSPKKRLAKRKNLRIYVPGYGMSSKVWVRVFQAHTSGSKSRRTRVRNARSYTCFDARKPKK